MAENQHRLEPPSEIGVRYCHCGRRMWGYGPVYICIKCLYRRFR